jgi:hypothetical protein
MFGRVDSARAFCKKPAHLEHKHSFCCAHLKKSFSPQFELPFRTFRKAIGLPELKVVLMLVFLMDLLFEVSSVGQKCRKGNFPRSVRNPAIPASLSKLEQFAS